MSSNLRHTETSFSQMSTESLCLQHTQMPRRRDLVIFEQRQTIALPLAHERGVSIPCSCLRTHLDLHAIATSPKTMNIIVRVNVLWGQCTWKCHAPFTPNKNFCMKPVCSHTQSCVVCHMHLSPPIINLIHVQADECYGIHLLTSKILGSSIHLSPFLASIYWVTHTVLVPGSLAVFFSVVPTLNEAIIDNSNLCRLSDSQRVSPDMNVENRHRLSDYHLTPDIIP